MDSVTTVPAPPTAETLLTGPTLGAALDHVARTAPAARVVFPASGQRLTVARLAAAATEQAHRLLAAGAGPGRTVGVLAGNTPAALTGFFAAAYAGAAVTLLPTPPAAGDPAARTRRLLRILDAAGLDQLVVDPALAPLGRALVGYRPGLRLLDPDQPASPTPRRALPRVGPDDLALLQYTSGSTTAPRGVELTHRAVLAGLRAILVSAAFTPRDVLVQWVPLFHDMGLMGLLSQVLNGADSHLFEPVALLRRPDGLLRYLSAHRATVFTGPNFCYDLLAERATPELVADLDLRAWRLAFNGSEPVSAATLDRFHRALAPAGLAPSVLFPVYGLAEATLAVTFPAPGSVPRVLHLDRERLGGPDPVRPLPPGTPGARALVSVGRPVLGVRLRLVAADGRPVPEGVLGEIQVAGDPVTRGYHRSAAATAAAFDGPWLRTGDLGLVLDGDLFVAGRRKEMVVVNGCNYFPEDVEAVARTVPGVFRGNCVAVAVPDAEYEGRERIGVIVEDGANGVSGVSTTARADLARRVRERVVAEVGVAAVEVYVVDRHWLTRTTSGKWQRLAAAGRLAELERP